MNFSVLISIYAKENHDHFEQALSSMETQTHSPNEIVLVKDGPLGEALENVISRHIQTAKIVYKIVALEKNRGLGEALNEGLKHCKHEWVARMDSDDIALPDRFEKQISYLEQHPQTDVLGGWICEFDDSPKECMCQRRVPSRHEDIVKFAKYRNPINHMTVMFRKTAVEQVGGYSPMRGFEDYYLWMRMLKAGMGFANLPEVLVKARTGEGMIARRQGWQYGMDELALEKAAYQIGFWSISDLIRNFFVRFLPRLLPKAVVERLYNLLRKY